MYITFLILALGIVTRIIRGKSEISYKSCDILYVVFHLWNSICGIVFVVFYLWNFIVLIYFIY